MLPELLEVPELLVTDSLLELHEVPENHTCEIMILLALPEVSKNYTCDPTSCT